MFGLCLGYAWAMFGHTYVGRISTTPGCATDRCGEFQSMTCRKYGTYDMYGKYGKYGKYDGKHGKFDKFELWHE